MRDKIFECVDVAVSALQWAVIAAWVALAFKLGGWRIMSVVLLPLYCAWYRGRDGAQTKWMRELDEKVERIKRVGR